MAYVTAITNRVLSDVTTSTSKGLWNVADWTRVYGNAELVSDLAAVLRGEVIVFNVVAAPTISTIPSVTNFNTLLANIERLRLAVADQSIVGAQTEIKDDYVAGNSEDAPDYIDANLWESTLNAIWAHYGGPDLDTALTLTGNLTIATATTRVIVDSLDTATYDIDIQGTGHLAII